jgi:hypothetical protein
MLRHSNLVISAWQGEHLAGIAGSLIVETQDWRRA